MIIYYIIIVVNGMRKLNNKGFTLIELVATVVILGMIMLIGGYAVTELIDNSRDKDYELLINEIKSAVEAYYQECKYVTVTCSDEGIITLGDLVNNGFLKGNSTIKTGNDKDKYTLVNPRDNENITSCQIKYTYSGGNFNVVAVSPTGSCPTSY